MIPKFQLGKKVVKYIDPERLYKIKRTKETLLSMREIINLNRINEILYLDKNEYVYVKDMRKTTCNKKDFIKMLNIMYEDQYLDDFTYYFYGYEECYHFHEKDYKKKYLEEFLERREDFKDFAPYDNYFNMIETEDNKMKTIFEHIETKNVVYELENWENINSYRKIIIFDPINNNYITPLFEEKNEMCCIKKIKKNDLKELFLLYNKNAVVKL